MTEWRGPTGPPSPSGPPAAASPDSLLSTSGPGTSSGPRTSLPSAARRIVNAVAGTRTPDSGSVATDVPTDRALRSSPDPSLGRRGPRRARLALRRIDPWSVLKVTFLLSLAMLVVFIVAVAVLYLVLDTLGVFSSIDSALQQVSSSTDPTSVTDVFSFSRAIGGAAVLGAVNVLLFTALATLGAFLYNLCAAIAGGIEVTLTE
ncbi:MAG: DUF3566 domain-containing protein [Frankiaceae bacterium]